MLPRRPAQIFRSRWSALYWAAGVIWTAVTVAEMAGTHGRPQPEAMPAQDALGQMVNDADLALLRNVSGSYHYSCVFLLM